MGEEASHFYLLESGAVKISRISQAGDERMLDLHKPGDVLGWLHVNRRERWTAAAYALSSATVCAIARQTFVRFMQATPALTLNVVDHLIDQHSRLLARLTALAHPEPGPRLLMILLDLADAGDSYTFPGAPTQGDLARMAGLNRSTVNLLIKEYRRRGILGGQRGVLVLHRDPAKALLWKAGLIFT
jgi:CRP-like cAMP-binding protein